MRLLLLLIAFWSWSAAATDSFSESIQLENIYETQRAQAVFGNEPQGTRRCLLLFAFRGAQGTPTPSVPAPSVGREMADALQSDRSSLLARAEGLAADHGWRALLIGTARELEANTGVWPYLGGLTARLSAEPPPAEVRAFFPLLRGLLAPYLIDSDPGRRRVAQELIARIEPTDPLLRRILVLSYVYDRPGMDLLLRRWRVANPDPSATGLFRVFRGAADDADMQGSLIDEGIARSHDRRASTATAPAETAANRFIESVLLSLMVGTPQSEEQWREVRWVVDEITGGHRRYSMDAHRGLQVLLEHASEESSGTVAWGPFLLLTEEEPAAVTPLRLGVRDTITTYLARVRQGN